MSDHCFYKEIIIGSDHLCLTIQDHQPLVEFEKEIFNHIWLLNQRLSVLSDIRYLKEFALISNFLWKGLEFEMIDSIHDYQKFYLEQIELERKYPHDIFKFRLTDYQIFDVSVMHDPLLEQETLFYFVYETSTALPYRVSCPFPYTSRSTLVHYQILPFLK